MNTLKRITFTVLFLAVTLIVFAQQKPAAPSSSDTAGPARADSARKINLVRSDLLRFENKDSVQLQILVGNAILRQGKTLFYGDSIVMNQQKNTIEVFGNIHINDADSVNVYSQYLIYHGNERVANLRKAVKLSDGKATLTTESLEYDLNSKTGTYLNGGKIVNGSSVLTSKEGYYYAETKDAYFKKNVRLVDPEYTMATDTLLYNVDAQLATFVAPTTINDGKSIIHTSDGYYNMQNGTANFGKRPVIQDSTQFITADHINFNKATGEGFAEGNFVYRDTAQGLMVLAEKSFFNRDKNTFLATEKPLMIIKQEADSLFITADTLYSGIAYDTVYVRDSTEDLHAQQAVVVARTDSLITSISKAEHSDPPGLLPPADIKKAGKPARGKMNRAEPEPPGQEDIVKAPALTPVPLPQQTDTSLQRTVPAEDSTGKLEDSLQKTALQASLKDSAAKSVVATEEVKKIIPREIDRVDSVRFFKGFHHVKMFADSMQAVCDSMMFSAKDSIFRLFNDPVVWSKESQISGDTIHLYTKNKKPERVEVWENAFSISKSNDELFNQLKGNTINGYFNDGEIEHISAKGSAESLYYLQDDDSAYTGANYAKADLINLYFVKKELNKITWVHQVEGGFYPIRQVPEENRRFRNFKWQEERRPKSKEDLFQ